MKYLSQEDTCTTEINFDIVDNKLRNVSFEGGCVANLKALSILVDGMEVERAIQLFEGIECQRASSCPNELAIALKQYL